MVSRDGTAVRSCPWRCSPGFTATLMRLLSGNLSTRSTALRRIAVFLVLAAFVAVGRAAHAYRPFDGTDADVAPPGEFELELGPVHYYRAAGTNYVIAPATVLNLGIIPRLELVVDFKDFVSLREPAAGENRAELRDTDVLLKIILRRGFLQGASGPSLAIETGPLLPETGTARAFGGWADTILSLGDEHYAAHCNAAMADSREHQLEVFGSVIAEVGRDWRAHPVAEVFVDRSIGGPKEYSALLGAIWPWRENLAFDVAGRAASLDGGPVWEIRLGITWSLRVWGGGQE